MERHRSRGQAVPEFAITVMLLISSMMFIFVVARHGVIGERAATALRVAGTVTQVQNPYRYASLDTVYQSANNRYIAASDQKTCTPPDTNILYGKGLLSGAESASFWNPSSIPSSPTCAFSMTRFTGTALHSGGDLLVHQFDYQISADAAGWTSSIADSAGNLFGGTQQNITQTARFYQAPSLETIMQCFSKLGPAVSASLNPDRNVFGASSTAPLSSGQANSIRTSIVVSATSCTNLIVAAGPYNQPPPALPFPAGSGGGTNTSISENHGSSSSQNGYTPPAASSGGTKTNPVGTGTRTPGRNFPGGSTGGSRNGGSGSGRSGGSIGSSHPGGNTSGSNTPPGGSSSSGGHSSSSGASSSSGSSSSAGSSGGSSSSGGGGGSSSSPTSSGGSGSSTIQL
jgi:hypothetical protein